MISEALKLVNLLIPSKERRDCVKMRELLDALSVALARGLDYEASVLMKEKRRLRDELEGSKTI